ncbi:MAG: hypothetical protein ACN4GM_07925 [Gammaproteobacteria bacterium]
MFDTAELNPGINRLSSTEAELGLGNHLLRAQQRILAAAIPVLILFLNFKGSDPGGQIKRLNQWLTLSSIRSRAFCAVSNCVDQKNTSKLPVNIIRSSIKTGLT